MKKQAWIIDYDIRNNKRLGRVYRLLSKEAIPIQYSIFYYEGTVNELKKLLNAIEERINIKCDDVRAYCLPAHLRYSAIGRSLLPEGIGLFSEANSELAHFLSFEDAGIAAPQQFDKEFMVI
ncbi:CRISPR-associated endoribonuclease Cas2 [Oligella sp. MSHR50489EDL]|uniref:CRISPR-associated endonuclease Cas2 n=1 Tax=Oligella sp. MSHR50489EDL TaxID=3139409 RepID=UPI003D81A6B3